MTALGGSEELYDLVIDTTHTAPEACAERILDHARGVWDVESDS